MTRAIGRWQRPAACLRRTSPIPLTPRSARRWIGSSPPWRPSTRPPVVGRHIGCAAPAEEPMQPKLELLSSELTARILDEAFQLLTNPGIRVLSREGRELLAGAGAQVDAA